MTDSSTPTPEDSSNDLASQLEALMKQAREGEAAGIQDDATNTAAVAESNPAEDPTPPEGTDALSSQLDALMAKVSEHGEAEQQAETTSHDPAIADGPPDVEAAFDDVQGAFDAVQDVIADLDQAEQAEPQADEETRLDPASETDEPTETQAELDAQENDLAAQVQSLLDEAQAEEDASFVSPEELLDEPNDEPAASEDDGLDGHFAATEDVIAEADAATKAETGEPVIEAAEPVAAEPAVHESDDVEAAEATDTGGSADDPPLIEQIDSLLADHAEDAISGEFESVDELLGVGSNVEDEGEGEEDQVEASEGPEEDADDELGGEFQSMDDLLGTPDQASDPTPEAEPDKPTREEMAVELDQLDGLFEAPAPIDSPAPAPPAEEASSEDDTAQDEDAAGGFEPLDDLLDAPPPTEDERDGAPPAAKAEPDTETAAAEAQGFTITFKLAALQAAAALLLGWSLWTCAIVNKPLDKMPEQIKQTVGWVALAVALPGMLLITYGLILN